MKVILDEDREVQLNALANNSQNVSILAYLQLLRNLGDQSILWNNNRGQPADLNSSLEALKKQAADPEA